MISLAASFFKKPSPTQVASPVFVRPPEPSKRAPPPSEEKTIAWLEAQPGYWRGRAAVRAEARRQAAAADDWEAAIHHSRAAGALERAAAGLPAKPGDQQHLLTQLAPRLSE
jgi:hypothetical protein